MAAHILVIDDDIGIIEAVQALLEDEGYDVTASMDSAIATELIQGRTQVPDLILLDVLLSGEDGRHICRALKNTEHIHNVPIIMMSAHPNIQSSIQACGADGFLPKPYEIDDLFSIIEEKISRTRYKE